MNRVLQTLRESGEQIVTAVCSKGQQGLLPEQGRRQKAG